MAPPTGTSERWTRWKTGIGFAMAMFGSTGTASSAPETFNTALPVAEGEFVFREQGVLDQSVDDPSGAEGPWRFLWLLSCR